MGMGKCRGFLIHDVSVLCVVLRNSRVDELHHTLNFVIDVVALDAVRLVGS